MYNESNYISRVDAHVLIGRSRFYLSTLENQKEGLPEGYCAYFPEIGEYQEILKPIKFDAKTTYYKREDIDKLAERLNRVKLKKLECRRIGKGY